MRPNGRPFIRCAGKLMGRFTRPLMCVGKRGFQLDVHVTARQLPPKDPQKQRSRPRHVQPVNRVHAARAETVKLIRALHPVHAAAQVGADG